jgi:hypothetical protein
MNVFQLFLPGLPFALSGVGGPLQLERKKYTHLCETILVRRITEIAND